MDNKTYRLTVYGFDSGLNEVLRGMNYDYRTRRVSNRVKHDNDMLCCDYIRFSCKELRGVVIHKPIVIHYKFWCKDARRDRMNIASAFDKSFEDALQKCGILKNDGWFDVLNVTYDFEICRNKPRVDIAIEEVDSVEENYPWEEMKD